MRNVKNQITVKEILGAKAIMLFENTGCYLKTSCCSLTIILNLQNANLNSSCHSSDTQRRNL